MAAGELLLFFQHLDTKYPLVLPMDATVKDAADEAQKAAQLPQRPLLTFQGDRLEQLDKPLADTGISSECVLHSVENLVLTLVKGRPPADAPMLARMVAARQGPVSLTATIPAGSTLRQLDEVVQQHGVTKARFYIQDQELCRGPRLLVEQGVKSGDALRFIPVHCPKKGRSYHPGAETACDLQVKMVSDALREDDAEDTLRSRCARAWLQQADEEQSSVASFAALTLRLMANAAPPPLLDAALQAGRDEIRHADICISVASKLGLSTEATKQVLPEHKLSVTGGAAELASRAFNEGAVGETIAAVCAGLAAEATEVPFIKEAQKVIARDEARHAALAWATAAWAVTSLPDGKEAAARMAVLAGAENQTAKKAVIEDDDDQLIAFGLVEGGLKQRVTEAAFRGLIQPMAAAIAAAQPLPQVPPGGGPVHEVMADIRAQTQVLLDAIYS
eukprot:TRINITY_DN464_c0_g1_i4.p1 TRINITY_DN464_c0_g1~~TRINITY_DN464_c0_g1_i4.p1  ORF type:complete len:448 (+),score=130.38 TRINITY_DN464_c0_g1_i4:69-1412(+)